MGKGWLLTWRSLLLSLLLHAVIAGVLFFSFDFTVAPPPKPKINIVNAVSVDKQQVEKEIKRLADREQVKRQKEIDRQKALEKKAAEVERKAKEEQKKLVQTKKKKQEAEKKREEKKQKEFDKKRQLEQERKKKEVAEKKREQERKRQEEEAKRLAAEKALQEQLEAERQAMQKQQDSIELGQYTLLIERAVENNFNKLGLESGLSCVILIRLLEGGKVADVLITQSSGNDLFDKRAEDAVYKTSPLPVPDEARLFNRMSTIEFSFSPRN